MRSLRAPRKGPPIAQAISTAEVSVAIDPANRDHIVVSAYQVNRPGGTRVSNVLFVSRDGGRTFDGDRVRLL
ncbi:MAG: hypothetical protein J0L85_18965 [Zoogloea sp.]|nr:hypothetical protein [Zoogloea sp.]